MATISDLFTQQIAVLNLGTPGFRDDVLKQGIQAVQVDWSPPAGGNTKLLDLVDQLKANDAIAQANELAVSRIKEAHPVLVGIDTAKNVIPGMHDRMILHAGPPITWDRMCGPMQGAVIGALLFEGLATTDEEAKVLAASGEIEFAPCNEHDAVGPMAGVTSASMPVHIIHNKTHGNYAYCTVNEGLGKVLRFGAYSSEVIDRLTWIKTRFAPALKTVLAGIENGIDIKAIISQALHMGDECHNRNKAATSLFYKEMSGHILNSSIADDVKKECLDFMRQNDHYFLNLSMPACKSALDAAHGIEYSTVVTTMARNGVDFGIRVSSCGKDQWFVAPANYVDGLLFPGFSPDDAAADLGDSAITETSGIGGFAMAAAPAIVQFVGGVVGDAIEITESMYEITTSENSTYSVPNLDFRGTPLGIDVVKVIETGILPVINTGIAHKDAGIGQIGAGIVHAPRACFEQAIMVLAQQG